MGGWRTSSRSQPSLCEANVITTTLGKPDFSLYPPRAEGTEELHGPFFMRALIPLSLLPNHFSKASLPNTLRINFQQVNCRVVVVVQSLSHVWLYNPMDCSSSGFPVLHHLPELAQTHVHWVSDGIQPSHPVSSPSPPAFSLSQHGGVFSNESALLIRWPKYWSFNFNISPSNEYAGSISFRMDWFNLLAVEGTLKHFL